MTSTADPFDDFDVVDARDRPFDPADPDTRIDFQIAVAEFAARQQIRSAAEQMGAIVTVVAEARRHPEVFVVLRGEPTDRDVEFAERAAIADLAVRLSLAEGTVAAFATQGALLRGRAPGVWAAFLEGDIAVANARRVADTLETLPADVTSDAALDAASLELAHLAPARFRQRLHTLRERLHPCSATERHAEAARARSVWREPDIEGMAWLGVHLTAADADAAWQRIDGTARHLCAQPGETRTIDQVRADVAADILTGRIDPLTTPRVTVGVLIPMLTLLGRSDAPATLEGYGPIDAVTARELTAHAPTFFRILTDPVSATVLDVDRGSYRPPADLKRWLALRDGTCRFAGCGRSAKNCDLDHTVDWAKGGPTAARNLAHLCRRHHTLKHRTRWSVAQHPDTTITWTSPTGAIRTADPPPF